MEYCSNCRKELNSIADVCSLCGFALTDPKTLNNEAKYLKEHISDFEYKILHKYEVLLSRWFTIVDDVWEKFHGLSIENCSVNFIIKSNILLIFITS